MARVDVSVTVEAPRDVVWGIVSDLDSEPRFWKGTKDVRNISRDGDTIRREITIAFRDQKCVQEVTVHAPDRIEARFVRGIINGTKDVVLSGEGDQTVLRAIWDVRLTGIMGVFGGVIRGHIKKGTVQALESIKAEAEGAVPGNSLN